MSYSLQNQLKMSSATTETITINSVSSNTQYISVDSTQKVLTITGCYVNGTTQIAIVNMYNNGNNLAITLFNPTSSEKNATITLFYLYTDS